MALVLASAGLFLSLAHVAVVAHRLDGWFWLEKHSWHSGFDGGFSAVPFGFHAVATNHVSANVVAALTSLVGLGLLIVVLRHRPSLAEGTYAVLATAMASLVVWTWWNTYLLTGWRLSV